MTSRLAFIDESAGAILSSGRATRYSEVVLDGLAAKSLQDVKRYRPSVTRAPTSAAPSKNE